MPDRYGDRPDPQLGDQPDELPHYGPTDAEIRAEAIQACQLCDPDGYHGNIVCDHIDHTETNRRGIAAVRNALNSRAQPPHQTPKNPPTGQLDGKTTPL